MNAGGSWASSRPASCCRSRDSMDHLRGGQEHRPDPQERRRHRLLLLARCGPKNDMRRLHRRRRQRPGLVHERLRRRHRGHQAGRHAARRQHGHPARRPSGHPGVHHLQAGRRPRSPTSTSRSAVTDDFMQAVEDDEEYALINPRTGEAVKKLKARKVFNSMVSLTVILSNELNPCGRTPMRGTMSCFFFVTFHPKKGHSSRRGRADCLDDFDGKRSCRRRSGPGRQQTPRLH